MFRHMYEIFLSAQSHERIITIVVIIAVFQVCIRSIQWLGYRLIVQRLEPRVSKTRTVAGLAMSVLVFSIYFVALGVILREFGLSLKAYFTSASIMGLAIGFGAQGLVQDVVTGITVVFSDLFDVGDMVEISGQTGIVQNVGVRFTVIENSTGARVYVPNRTITNVVNYPRGYVRVLVDVTLPKDASVQDRIVDRIATLVASCADQFPGIMINPPSIEGRIQTAAGKEYLRIKFRLWPGCGHPIDTSFKSELVSEIKVIDGSYQEWMVSVNYEVEKKTTELAQYQIRKRKRTPS